MLENKKDTSPKVFISYCWDKQAFAREIADRLLQDGVDVVIDIYDLKQGNDKNVFMENMVSDKTITHVLVLIDRRYTEKADNREAGVGTESQIISHEVYKKTLQEKFIPIALEINDTDNQPYLPVFFQSRIYIDFSSPEKCNEHWEELIRVLYGKPQYQKPKIGKPPLYLTEETILPPNKMRAKFDLFRQAVIHDKKIIKYARQDFFSSCYEYAETFRVREQPEQTKFGQKIIDDCGKLVYVRNFAVDWIMLESSSLTADEFTPLLIGFMENLLEIASRPIDLMSWADWWFEAEQFFVYETFLYSIAALLKSEAFETLHRYFRQQFKMPETDGNGDFDSYACFYTNTPALHEYFKHTDNKNYSSAGAEQIKRQAQRADIPFEELIQADLLAYLMGTIVCPDGFWGSWYPQLLAYASNASRPLPFFLKATRHDDFSKLACITGVQNADQLRKTVQNFTQKHPLDTPYFRNSPWILLNMEKLDTI